MAAVEDALGWDARDAEIIQGTSAGAELAALLGSGIGSAEILADLDAVTGAGTRSSSALLDRLRSEPAPRPPRPALSFPALGLVRAALARRVDSMAGLAGLLPRGRGDARFLREFADALEPEGGWPHQPGQSVRLMAADTSTGQIVAFGSPQAPSVSLADALTASWAIPGWYPPVRIARRSYVDGGTVSPTSAQLLDSFGLEEVVIIAPMSTHGGAPGRGLARAERLLRRPMTKRVDREVAHLVRRGINVLRVEPGPADLGVMGPNFTDSRRRGPTLTSARQQIPLTLNQILGGHS